LLERPLVRGGIALAVIAVAVGVVVAAQAGRDSDGDGVSGDPTPGATEVAYAGRLYTLCEEQGDVRNEPPVVGHPAPDFALCDASGQPAMRLSEMTGKVVWLNFWATWCVPCKKELPDIQALYDEKQAQGLDVLIINYRESQAKAAGFLTSIDIDLPLALDRSGEVYDRYKLAGLPDNFFIDREGKLAAVYYGFVTDEIARERLEMAGLE